MCTVNKQTDRHTHAKWIDMTEILSETGARPFFPTCLLLLLLLLLFCHYSMQPNDSLQSFFPFQNEKQTLPFSLKNSQASLLLSLCLSRCVLKCIIIYLSLSSIGLSVTIYCLMPRNFPRKNRKVKKTRPL